MYTDATFLAHLEADPTDDTTRLVYADWLDEQGDAESAAKAEFLRGTVQLVPRPGQKGGRKARRKRLQKLAAGLDAAWLAVVSHLAIENCYRKRTEDEARRDFRVPSDYLCDRR